MDAWQPNGVSGPHVQGPGSPEGGPQRARHSHGFSTCEVQKQVHHVHPQAFKEIRGDHDTDDLRLVPHLHIAGAQFSPEPLLARSVWTTHE